MVCAKAPAPMVVSARTIDAHTPDDIFCIKPSRRGGPSDRRRRRDMPVAPRQRRA
jgi:hypothetical protein